MFIRASISLKLKFSVTADSIIDTGPVVGLIYFLGGWDTPNPLKKKIPKYNLKIKLCGIMWCNMYNILHFK